MLSIKSWLIFCMAIICTYDLIDLLVCSFWIRRCQWGQACIFFFLNSFTTSLKQLLLHLTLTTTKKELEHNSAIKDGSLWLKPFPWVTCLTSRLPLFCCLGESEFCNFSRQRVRITEEKSLLPNSNNYIQIARTLTFWQSPNKGVYEIFWWL